MTAAYTPIIKQIDVTADYAALSATSLVGKVDISCPPSNAGVVYFLGDDEETDVPWQPGEWHSFDQVDLAGLQIKGTVGDVVTIVGEER